METESIEPVMKKSTSKQLSFLDRFLTLWIFLANVMVVNARN